jgi:hypothetical protein
MLSACFAVSAGNLIHNCRHRQRSAAANAQKQLQFVHAKAWLEWAALAQGVSTANAGAGQYLEDHVAACILRAKAVLEQLQPVGGCLDGNCNCPSPAALAGVLKLHTFELSCCFLQAAQL